MYGQVNIAKPVLLLALLEGVSEGIFLNNRFVLNEWLEKRYTSLSFIYKREAISEGTTGIDKPFWHLQSDGFGHLHYLNEELPKAHTPTRKWLKDNVRFASFDDDLWMLLQNSVMRQRLCDYIIEHKLPKEI